MAQADPAPRTRTRTAAADAAGNGKAPAARRRTADKTGGPRAEPSLRIIETRVLRGPNYWAREPVIRQVVDLGVLEEFPSNKIPGFVDALVGMLPTLEDHACSLGRRGGFITRLREGTWVGHVVRAHRARVPEPRRHRRPPRQDARHRGVRPLQRDLRVPRGAGRDRGRQGGRRARQPPRRAERPGRRVRPDGRDGEADPSRGAAGLRAVDPGAARRGRGARHPVHPARPVQPGPAGAGRPPAADPGDDDLADQRHRGRCRVRQEAHQPTARFGGPAGAPLRGGRGGGRGGRGRQADRLSVRAQAARRQPRAGRRPEPADGGRGPSGLQRRGAPDPERRRRRRELHHRQRLSRPRHRRQARGGRRARPGQRHRRRRAHDPRTWSTPPTPTRGAASATRRS